jgi:hypothetical protein
MPSDEYIWILLSSMYIFHHISFSKGRCFNEFQVWKFFITFADVLRLPSFTLDEFIQALHDYVSFGIFYMILMESCLVDMLLVVCYVILWHLRDGSYALSSVTSTA